MQVFRRQAPILLVDQLTPIRTDLLRALETADERERPGLEAALQLVNEYSPAELRRRWVLGILDEASVDPRTHAVKAVKALRDAVPSLSLIDANALVKEAAAD
jgi:hypothetical protein